MLSKCDFRKSWPTSTVANCHPMSVEWSASLLFCLFLFACLLPDKVLAAEEESAIGKSEKQRPAEATTCAFDVSGCGLTKGCLMKPHNCTPHKDCAYAMSYSADGERVFFELLGKVEAGRNVFVALGFSVDGLMGGDAVTDCASFDGSPFAARLSYNPGKSNRKVPLDQEKMAHILNTEATAYADGILYCRFSQLIQPPGWVQPQFVRSLHTSIYILMSSGPTRGNELTIHSLNMDSPLFPFSSPTPVQLTAFQADPALRQVSVTSAAENVTTGSGSNGQAKNSNELPSLLMSSPMASEEETSTGTEEEMLTKAHGVLMLLAWLLLCPFAILSARFLRSEPTQLLGLHLWFQVHRAANSLVFLLVLASFVCIFSANGGAWLGPTSLLSVDNFTAHSMHAFFGAAAILLTVCQPLNALFRCSPQSAARFLFDWLHAILGYAAWLCAAVAISIACFRFKNKFWDHFLARDLLIAALALIIVSFCVLQWFSLRHNRQLRREEGNRKAAAATTTTTTVPIPNDGGGEQHIREGLLIQRAILGLFLATASGLSLALALLVILAGT